MREGHGIRPRKDLSYCELPKARFFNYLTEEYVNRLPPKETPAGTQKWGEYWETHDFGALLAGIENITTHIDRDSLRDHIYLKMPLLFISDYNALSDFLGNFLKNLEDSLNGRSSCGKSDSLRISEWRQITGFFVEEMMIEASYPGIRPFEDIPLAIRVHNRIKLAAIRNNKSELLELFKTTFMERVSAEQKKNAEEAWRLYWLAYDFGKIIDEAIEQSKGKNGEPDFDILQKKLYKAFCTSVKDIRKTYCIKDSKVLVAAGLLACAVLGAATAIVMLEVAKIINSTWPSIIHTLSYVGSIILFSTARSLFQIPEPAVWGFVHKREGDLEEAIRAEKKRLSNPNGLSSDPH